MKPRISRWESGPLTYPNGHLWDGLLWPASGKHRIQSRCINRPQPVRASRCRPSSRRTVGHILRHTRSVFPHIAQCLKLEHEFHHAASKLCILGFQTLKQSLIARTPLIKARGCRIPHWQNGFFEDVFIRTASAWPARSRASCRLSTLFMNHPHYPLFSPNHWLDGSPSLPECPQSLTYVRKEAPRWRGLIQRYHRR
jgi:hypothetical protein